MNGVQILLIIGLGIFVSSMAKRRGVEPGMIIVVLAAAASFIPGVPRLELESEVILAIVIPPLLYSATRGASFANFEANLRSIWALGVVLVAVTCGALGFALLVTLGTLLLQGTTCARPPTTPVPRSSRPRAGRTGPPRVNVRRHVRPAAARTVAGRRRRAGKRRDDSSFAINHIPPYALTTALAGRMADPARVVQVTSSAMMAAGSS